MAESTITRRAGGGFNIEEITQSYLIAPGETITAGSFVNYVENFIDYGLVGELGQSPNIYFNSGSTVDLNIITLDENNVLFVYTSPEGTNFGRGVARVATINGTNITFGPENTFSAANTSPTFIQAVSLTPNKIAINWYEIGLTSSSRFHYVIVGTISGTSITFGGATTHVTTSNKNIISRITKLNENKIVVAGPISNTNGHMTSRVGTISGNTVSFGSEFTFSFANTGGVKSLGIVALSETEVFYFYRNQSNSAPSGKIGTISGTSITFGSEYVHNTSERPIHVDIKLLKTNTVVIAYTNESDTNSYNLIASVSGTVITFNGKIRHNENEGGGAEFNSVLVMNENLIIISYSVGGTLSPRSKTIKINGTSFSEGLSLPYVFGENNQFYRSLSSTKIGNKIVVGSNGTSRPGRAVVGTFGNLLFNANSFSEKVSGIAKTGGTAGQTIEVFVNT